MAHTGRCSGAARPACSCACGGALHGYHTGHFAPVQTKRLTTVNLPVQITRRAHDANVDTTHCGFKTHCKKWQGDLIEEIARELVALTFREDRITSIISAASDAAENSLPSGPTTGRQGIQSQLEFHLLCSLFLLLVDMADATGAAAKRTVEELLRTAFSSDGASVEDAAITGAVSAVGDRASDAASDYFLAAAGLPDARTLTALAIMFCPNSQRHRDVAAAEESLSRELAGEIIRDYMEKNE